MSDVERCCFCGGAPRINTMINTIGKPAGFSSAYCCGVTCSDLDHWNTLMLAARELGNLEKKCSCLESDCKTLDRVCGSHVEELNRKSREIEFLKRELAEAEVHIKREHDKGMERMGFERFGHICGDPDSPCDLDCMNREDHPALEVRTCATCKWWRELTGRKPYGDCMARTFMERRQSTMYLDHPMTHSGFTCEKWKVK